MLSDHKEKCEMRRRAVLEAIRFCGGVVAFSNRLNINRSRASNWVNQPGINIPYEYVILTEDLTQVSIERLSPFTEDANKVVRRLRDPGKTPAMTVAFKEIIIGKHPYYRCQTLKRPIIVGTDRVLISGLAQIEAYKKRGLQKIQIIVLDLVALTLGIRSLQDFKVDFLVSERVAIGVRLEYLQGVNEKQAGILGFSDQNTYRLAKQIYFQGISNLISLVDEKQISIDEAGSIATLTTLAQESYLKKIGYPI